MEGTERDVVTEKCFTYLTAAELIPLYLYSVKTDNLALPRVDEFGNEVGNLFPDLGQCQHTALNFLSLSDF